ncbi:hypothetical protein BpHYR1_001196 [Brachionus plicatilis]|uniref:Uncharacterized protein n=1 Tax=Brachionus plicatilis TaxID=10195 RepID=A0A3M7PAH8_BRAPC|nr:hypothetical protein BpHYR1_001196 [Brachionus plicatilis]
MRKILISEFFNFKECILMAYRFLSVKISLNLFFLSTKGILKFRIKKIRSNRPDIQLNKSKPAMLESVTKNLKQGLMFQLILVRKRSSNSLQNGRKFLDNSKYHPTAVRVLA